VCIHLFGPWLIEVHFIQSLELTINQSLYRHQQWTQVLLGVCLGGDKRQDLMLEAVSCCYVVVLYAIPEATLVPPRQPSHWDLANEIARVGMRLDSFASLDHRADKSDHIGQGSVPSPHCRNNRNSEPACLPVHLCVSKLALYHFTYF
jgi:hypothetical protein